jgi:hypothetical protein
MFLCSDVWFEFFLFLSRIRNKYLLDRYVIMYYRYMNYGAEAKVSRILIRLVPVPFFVVIYICVYPDIGSSFLCCEKGSTILIT